MPVRRSLRSRPLRLVRILHALLPIQGPAGQAKEARAPISRGAQLRALAHAALHEEVVVVRACAKGLLYSG
jgi:hypothetical protein